MFKKLPLLLVAATIWRAAATIDSNDNAISKRQADTNESDEGFPPFIELLRGRDGRDGRDGEPGAKGPPGVKGDPGDAGRPGLQGPSGGGVVYIRWGNTTCPDTPGTELVYSGRAAGTFYSHKGGTSDYLCLPSVPQYQLFRPGVQGSSPIYGAEYQIDHSPLPLAGIHDDNVPCAVCRSSKRSSFLMVPARTSCPDTWTKEYEGYLMTEHINFYRRAAVCMDKNPAVIAGEVANTNGALFYHTEAACNGIQCPPYEPEKELTCAVCTK